jgi:peptidoglycan LD-endopeptidase CwlK
MPIDLSVLAPAFARQVQEVLDACRQRGVEMRPYCAVRHPFAQARLWRQSRSIEEIERKIAEFRREGADFLAYCLESVGPQYGKLATCAPPGFSWHQWGEAVDCYWFDGDHAQWSVEVDAAGVNGYRVYAEEAKRRGLEPGGLWQSIADWPHVQLQAAGSPMAIMSTRRINDEMESRFEC